jgi:hypothetical protein
MYNDDSKASTLRGWLRDPMIRLVMESDGVTDEDMIALVRRVCDAVASRPASMAHTSQWRVPDHHYA